MCTVSYLPLEQGNFIITSNRDETPARNALGLRRTRQDGHEIIYPVDPGAGGSWIGCADTGRVCCLLNGAYVPFAPDPRYTRSRGHILLDALTKPDDQTFEEQRLLLTAPFTLVRMNLGQLQEIIWDGTALHTALRDPEVPGFWSSVTLYPADVRKWRQTLFESWLDAHETYQAEDIIDFHKYGSDDPWNGFVMNREERVRTLSVSCVIRKEPRIDFLYDDLLNKTTKKEVIESPHNVETH